MALLFYSIFGFLIIYHSYSFELVSPENNPPASAIISPFYDAIIFSDIADLLNEFGNNENPVIEALVNSESESDENIEDLLTEYQQHLDRAHQQRKTYLEKSKSKNKLPLYRHETFVKKMPRLTPKKDSIYNAKNLYNPTEKKISLKYFNSPLDMIIPLNGMRQQPKLIMENNEFSAFQSLMSNPKRFNLPIVLDTVDGMIPPHCICKTNTLPCDCGCKECLLPLNSMARNDQDLYNSNSEKINVKPWMQFTDQSQEISNINFEHNNENPRGNDNTLNVRIKVEIQVPKTQEAAEHHCKNHNHSKSSDKHMSSKNTTSINSSGPLINFPIPLEVFGFQKTSKVDGSGQSHKYLNHKKKKPKFNTSNKKHKKKVPTYRKLKLTMHKSKPTYPIFEEYQNQTKNSVMDNTSIELNKTTEASMTLQTNTSSNAEQTNINQNITSNLGVPDLFNTSLTEDNIDININGLNVSDELKQIENTIDIETEDPKINSTIIIRTDQYNNTRLKREIGVNKEISTKKHFETDMKLTDKSANANPELLYWPIIIMNSSPSKKTIEAKNITSIILDRELKKNKLNISQEIIRQNHTVALEKAIFGEVNWDDMDTVAPVFISFVGKYLNGVLTFCSQTSCHSIKCADKRCVHRTCKPEERTNQRGHCATSDAPESIASMESIMDLPTKVAFDIVDILQNKMEGKLYGKGTLCINPKCISFAAVKKSFLKAKCTVKELTPLGHCLFLKS
ncbi:hypothetical protein JYU34_005760 [Plutella xylostella]|uniref:Uncharacterized protein n=1 Tax=Plutella xylostella TaxID=51655 RepID=A0ABQ7QU21_PLUXY|nr:hypothetical protein JYU34_005760 [Plutella xylostella]